MPRNFLTKIPKLKEETPKFRESTIRTVELLLTNQNIEDMEGNLDKRWENIFEILNNYRSKLQWLFNEQGKKDKKSCKSLNAKLSTPYINFQDIPTQILPWIFYTILLSSWVKQRIKNKGKIGFNIETSKLSRLDNDIKIILTNLWINGVYIERGLNHE